MTSTVAVIGGGYGGAAAAKALDQVADVTLVEPRETFVHHVAALRAVVDPDWVERIFLPYDGLLARGRVLRDRAVRISANRVELASGPDITADYVVLATGSSYPFPAKIDVTDVGQARAKLRAAHDALAPAGRVLLLGAGPVGLEFAGEIASAWPDKAVTVVDPLPDLVGGRFPDEFRTEIRAQLADLGVELLLGTALREQPPTEPGQAGTFTVTTESGATVTADVWFTCYGGAPQSGLLTADLGATRQPDARVAVTPELRVRGQDSVFAIGDVTAVPEMKMARIAQMHAEVVAANIRTLIEGAGDLVAHEPAADGIAIPLGPKGGATYFPEVGVLGAEATADIKGGLFLDMYRDLLGVGR